MNLSLTEKKQLSALLLTMKRDIGNETLSLVGNLKSEIHDGYADPSDRAKSEDDHSITLRIEDRKQKLISKIDGAIRRLQDNTMNSCAECGQSIGFKRLLARPVTDLCIQCKSRAEQIERNKKP